MIECIPAITWTAETDGSGTSVNKRWSEYSGLPPEAASGSGWQTTLHPEDAPATSKTERDPSRMVNLSKTKFGFADMMGISLVPFALCSLARRGRKILKWCGSVLTDIEDRRQAEEGLRQRTASCRRSTGIWNARSIWPGTTIESHGQLGVECKDPREYLLVGRAFSNLRIWAG